MSTEMSLPSSPIDPVQRGIRPAYVRFSRKSREDREASIRAGHTVELHEDIAHINPPGSRDCVEREVNGWLDNLARQVNDRQIPPTLADYYRGTYERWCNGQEMPPDGTPIRGWQLLTSSEQERVIGANILTVEDLAEANFDHLQGIGMGAMAMAAKAKNWLAVGQDKGAVALELQALREKAADQQRQIEALTARRGTRSDKGRKRSPRARQPKVEDLKQDLLKSDPEFVNRLAALSSPEEVDT